MSPEIRRKALRAAQKLALGITLAGCSTMHEMPADESDAGERDLGAMLDDAGSTPMEILDAMIANDAGTLVDATTPTDANPWADLGVLQDSGSRDGGPTVNTCNAALAEYVNGFESEVPPLRPTDTQCCTDIQAHVDADETTWGVWDDEGVRSYCCGTVLEWRSGGSCTPWGPPMPPAMPTVDEETFV